MVGVIVQSRPPCRRSRLILPMSNRQPHLIRRERDSNPITLAISLPNLVFDLFGNWIKRTEVSMKWTGDETHDTYRIIDTSRIIKYEDMTGRDLLNLLMNEYTSKSERKRL